MSRASNGRMASPLLIIGAVFSIMGSVFLALGIFLNTLLFEGSKLFLFIYGGIGLLFLIIGLCLLFVSEQKNRMRERLIADGNYLRAEITGTECNYNIRVNGRCPYIVLCRYKDTEGVVHIFKSGYLSYDPSDLFVSSTVMVYVDRNDFSKYYVDTASALPRVEIH